MSIRFPKRCKTKKQKSEHASYVASVRWSKHRAAKPLPVHIGYIEFGGALADGSPMRLDLVAVDGERKLTGIAEGRILPDRLSERSILRMVRAVLRAPRYFASLPHSSARGWQAPQSPAGFAASIGRVSPLPPFAAICEAMPGLISPPGGKS